MLYKLLIRSLSVKVSLNYVISSRVIQNKAGYTATEVACGWAGAIFEVTRTFGQKQFDQRNKIIKKVKCDRPTDKAGCRVACTRLKIFDFYSFWGGLEGFRVEIEKS